MTYSRHPGDARVNARCVRDLASSSKFAKLRQVVPSSACPRIRRFLSLIMRGWAPFWRPNLAYGYTFLARQEPKKSCIGNKDLAPFWRFCCGLLILIVKDEEFVLVNHGRTVITFTPGSYVLYIPKNRLWGPKNGPGAVSRRPETPRNSRTLRDRSRGQKCCAVSKLSKNSRTVQHFVRKFGYSTALLRLPVSKEAAQGLGFAGNCRFAANCRLRR